MGKPLISDAVLRGMFAAMQAMRAAKRDHTFAEAQSRADRAAYLAEPESLVAATLSQLHRRDTLLTRGAQPLVQAASAAWSAHRLELPKAVVCPGTDEECAAVAAGVALRRAAAATRENATQPVVVALLRSYPPLTGVLRLMEEHELSLILIAQGEAETRSDAQKRMAGTRVPLLPVDAADAVALCRVLQESMLRARHGWGGVVIHATRLPGVQDPTLSLRQHLQARHLLD